MQFTILTVLISTLTLLFKYLNDYMKERDYNKLIVLKHDVINKWYINKLVAMSCLISSSCLIALLLLLLSQYEEGSTKEPTLAFYFSGMIILILVPIMEHMILNFISIKLKSQIHHSISIDTKKCDKISSVLILIPSIIIFLVYYVLIDFNNTSFSAGIAVILTIVTIIYLLICICINYYYKSQYNNAYTKYNEFDDVNIHTNIYINTKEQRKIDLYYENISIDEQGNVWIFECNNVQKDLVAYKLNDSTKLVIDSVIIDETNYTAYIS